MSELLIHLPDLVSIQVAEEPADLVSSAPSSVPVSSYHYLFCLSSVWEDLMEFSCHELAVFSPRGDHPTMRATLPSLSLLLLVLVPWSEKHLDSVEEAPD